jgi:uncharacterized protein YndB with AHSA1/START domain
MQFFVRAAPTKVFRTMTEPAGFNRWFSDAGSLEPREGGRYEFRWTGGFHHAGKVLEFVRGKRILLTWEYENEKGLGPTTFEMSVLREGRGTLFKLEQTGFPRNSFTQVYEGAIWGWTYFGMNLKSVLETGHDLRSSSDG